MGTNNLETKNPGDVISSSDPNQYKDAITQAHVPRNSSGVPTDVAGGLGSTLYRWTTSYISKIFFGTAAQECSIENDGNNLKFKIANVIKSLITSDGFDGSYIKTGTIPETSMVSARRLQVRRYTASGASAVTWPTDANSAMVLGCGGGGGGGGAEGNVNGGGGGGGQGSVPSTELFVFTAGGAGTVTLGAGGAGGNGDTNLATGDGVTGGATTVEDTTTGNGLRWSGGRGGNRCAVAATSGGGWSFEIEDNIHRSGSGSGSSVNAAAASSGSRTAWAVGGAGGDGPPGSYLSGGGGGAGHGPGGAGGASNGPGATGENGVPGIRGGGGGGGGAGGALGGDGGAGGRGYVEIAIVTATSWEGTVS
jgi:hypothetical protein